MCNKCECKQTICEGSRKLNPNAKKDSNPEPTMTNNETLTKLNKSIDSNFLLTAYPKAFNNEVNVNSSSHYYLNSSSHKSYITVNLQKPLHLKIICNGKIIRKTFELTEEQNFIHRCCEF